MFFPKNVFSQSLQITSHSVVYTKNTTFGPFRLPDGTSESRNSSPLSKSVAPIRLNLVSPKPDCPLYQQTSRCDGILVQLHTNEKKHVFYVFYSCFFPLCSKRFFSSNLPTLFLCIIPNFFQGLRMSFADVEILFFT